MSDVLKEIEAEVKNNKVLLYGKGTKDAPQCGFTAATLEVLNAVGKPFEMVDVLSNPDRRANVPQYSQWPTFPQLFVKGELVGGCDIVQELHAKGELSQIIEKAFEG